MVRFVDSKCKKHFGQNNASEWKLEMCVYVVLVRVCVCGWTFNCIKVYACVWLGVCVCVYVCVWRRMKTSAWWVEKKREWKFFPNHLEKNRSMVVPAAGGQQNWKQREKKSTSPKKARTMNQKLSPLFLSAWLRLLEKCSSRCRLKKSKNVARE